MPRRKNPITEKNLKVISNGTFEYIMPYLASYNSGKVIEWFETNPETSQLERRRKKIKRIESISLNEADFYRRVSALIKTISDDLRARASISSPASKKYMLLSKAANEYLREKHRTLRKDTDRVYRSHINMLFEWLKSIRQEGITVKRFSREMANQYIRHQFIEKEVSPVTLNNYIRCLKRFFNWVVDNNYRDDNPFDSIRKRDEPFKRRVVIPKDWDEKIIEYCDQNDPRFKLIIYLVYGSFLRPAEICRVKIRDIHWEQSAIYVPAENSKNKHERWAILPQYTCRLMRELEIDKAPLEAYMISTSLKPGYVKKETRDLDKHWTKMRKAIGMPMEFQLYSFRDTGIMDLKDQGMPDHYVMKLTGHLEPAMIEKYKHAPSMESLRLSASYINQIGKRDEINPFQNLYKPDFETRFFADREKPDKKD